jgi:hypothetical protein
MVKPPAGAGVGPKLNLHGCVDMLDYFPWPFLGR